jgi:hypothetical protein
MTWRGAFVLDAGPPLPLGSRRSTCTGRGAFTYGALKAAVSILAAGHKHARRCQRGSAYRLARSLGAKCIALPLLLYAGEAAAYRTAQDTPELSGVGRVAWSDAKPVFHLNRTALPTGVNERTVEEVLVAALDAWTEPECTVVNPRFGGWVEGNAGPGDGFNTVQWAPDWTARAFLADAPGHADIQYRAIDDVWSISEADVYLNAENFAWSEAGNAESTDLFAVLTHELGHALGLYHPCEPDGSDGAPVCGGGGAVEAEATMNPFYSPAQRTLAPDDRDGICFLYPECGGCEENEICHEGECRLVCGDALCADGLVCGYWGCSLPERCLEADCTGDPCDDDGACAPLSKCSGGVCARGGADWGEACGATADCAAGACVDSVCQPACFSNGDCGEGGMCVPGREPLVSGCVSSRAYDLGQTCRFGDDCRSGMCVLERDKSFCSEFCNSDADCPSTYWCNSVGGEDVCMPKLSWSDGGCALSLSRTTPMWGVTLTALMLLAASFRRRGLGNSK